MALNILVEFGGGLQTLFGNKKKHDVVLPAKEADWTLGDLIFWMKDHLLQAKLDMFIQDNALRPGILVVVNDTDWELMDTEKYILQPKDNITFISTLHGG